MSVTVSMPVLLIQTLLSVVVGTVLEFFVFGGDYTRTERLEYEDDEYYYYVKAVPKGDITALVDEYYSKYTILLEGRDPEEFKRHVAVQAQIEAGLEKFLLEKDYHAIVTHFGDLGELQQLPGLAIQRLMEKGYGFGAEGDWKTAAMVRLMKIMTQGMKDAKGTSFMEDYTYNLVPGKEGILEATCWRCAPPLRTGKSASRPARCPWATGRTRPGLYSHPRQVTVSPHP